MKNKTTKKIHYREYIYIKTCTYTIKTLKNDKKDETTYFWQSLNFVKKY